MGLLSTGSDQFTEVVSMIYNWSGQFTNQRFKIVFIKFGVSFSHEMKSIEKLFQEIKKARFPSVLLAKIEDLTLNKMEVSLEVLMVSDEAVAAVEVEVDGEEEEVVRIISAEVQTLDSEAEVDLGAAVVDLEAQV